MANKGGEMRRRQFLSSVAALLPLQAFARGKGALNQESTQPLNVSFAAMGGVENPGVDNSDALEAAIKFLNARGGGTLAISAAYAVRRCVPLLPKVSLDMRGGKLYNSRPDVPSYGLGQVLLPGNFHPNYTQNFKYHPAQAVDGLLNELRIDSLAPELEPGDQVFIASKQTSKTGPYKIPLYGWLNVVESVSGSIVEFRYPVDVPNLELGVARLANEVCRDNRPAFFWQDASINGGEVASRVWNWVSDSAMLNCTISNLTSRGAMALYGNTIQRTLFRDCTFYFRNSVGEASHNSYKTLIKGCRFICIAPANKPVNGLSLQECAREIRVVDFHLDFAAAPVRDQVLRTIDTQSCLMERGWVIGNGTSGLSSIQLGVLKNPSANEFFNVRGNQVIDVKLKMNSARAVLIFVSEYSYGNSVERVTAEGTFLTDEAVRITASADAGSMVAITDSHFSSGGVLVVGPGKDLVKLDVGGSNLERIY